MKLKNENFGAINEKYEFIGEMTNFNGNLEENVKISIIIPVYNVEQYIEECIDSLRKQTLRQIEIICVDDCSEDKSLTIIMQYVEIDERIKVVSLRENKSASIVYHIFTYTSTHKAPLPHNLIKITLSRHRDIISF